MLLLMSRLDVSLNLFKTLHAVSFVLNGFHLTYEEKLDDVRKLDRVQEVPACGRINKGDLRMRCAIIS